MYHINGCQWSGPDGMSRTAHQRQCSYREPISQRANICIHIPETGTTSPSWGGEDNDSFIPEVPLANLKHHHVQDAVTTREFVKKQRSTAQEEALGYNSTMLLNISSLSANTRELLDEARNQRKDDIRRLRRQGTSHLSTTSMPNIQDMICVRGGQPDQPDESDLADGPPDLTLEMLGAYIENDQAYRSNGDDHSDDGNPLFQTYSEDDDESFQPDDESLLDDGASSMSDDFEGTSHPTQPHGDRPEYPVIPTAEEFATMKQECNADVPNEPNKLQAYEIACSDLLHRLSKHRLDLKVYDVIMEWLSSHISHSKGDLFANQPPSQCKKRTLLLSHLRKTFSKSSKLTVKDVQLPSEITVTIPVMDFVCSARNLLANKSIVNSTNLMQDNMDPITFLPKTKIVDVFRHDVRPGQYAPFSRSDEAELLKAPPLPSPQAIHNTRIEILYDHVEEDVGSQWYTAVVKEVLPDRSSPPTQYQLSVIWDANRELGHGVSRATHNHVVHLHEWWHRWRYPFRKTSPCPIDVNCEEPSPEPKEYSKYSHHDVDSPEYETMREETMKVAVGDIYTGAAISEGIEMFVPPKDLYPHEGVHVRPFPIIMFIDKSHTDLFGSLAVTPIMWVPAFLNYRCRMKQGVWRVLAYLPPLNVGKGSHAGKLDIDVHSEGAQRRTVGYRPQEAKKKLMDLHTCLEVGLRSFKKAAKRGFLHRDENGVLFHYYPFISAIIGDTSGNNELTCHYNCSGNSKISCPSNSCQCNFDELMSSTFACQP